MLKPIDFDFIEIKDKFNKLSNGDKAELRRVTKQEDIFKISVSYRLLPKGEKPSKQWQRVLFFIAFGEHEKEGKRLGELFARLGIKEQKFQQMVKISTPNDLLLLRDLIKWADQKDLLKLDYQSFGQALYYWGATSKQAIEKDYFLTRRKIAEELSEIPVVEAITELVQTLKDVEKDSNPLPISSALLADTTIQAISTDPLTQLELVESVEKDLTVIKSKTVRKKEIKNSNKVKQTKEV